LGLVGAEGAVKWRRKGEKCGEEEERLMRGAKAAAFFGMSKWKGLTRGSCFLHRVQFAFDLVVDDDVRVCHHNACRATGKLLARRRLER